MIVLVASMCLSNKQTNTRYCLFDRLEKFCLFVWSEVVKRTQQSVQVLFGDHPEHNWLFHSQIDCILIIQRHLISFLGVLLAIGLPIELSGEILCCVIY